MSRRCVATFNVGSSSLKFSLFAITEQNQLEGCLLRGAVRNLTGSRKVDLAREEDTASLSAALEGLSAPADLISALAHWLSDRDPEFTLVGAGHRVVHGGTSFDHAVPAEDAVLEKLGTLAVFAPAHQPHNLAGIRALEGALPDIPQTLSFDTAFHRTIPWIAELYALPRALSQEGLLRFGFHGLSYAHIAETIGDVLGARPERLLALHLGSGASACALLGGKSIATSMGLTALDGLPMATRCGDLDPGVVLHLIHDRKMTSDEVADLLYKKSGLLGVSGISSDPRVLLESDAPEAAEAIDLYCYRIALQAGSLIMAMEGLDGIVFSGGVGENAPEIRSRILQHLHWLGVELDAEANLANAPVLSPDGATIPIARIIADEERIIARDCAALL